MSKVIVALLLCLVTLGSLPSAVQAQGTPVAPMNLTLSPISISLETEPGTPVATQIRVRNNGQVTEQLQVTIGSFKADETGEKPVLLDKVEDNAFLSWLVPSTSQFTVPPGEWATLDLTFSPPDTAALSYFYAVYLSRPEITTEGSQTVINPSPAILVLTKVKSPYTQQTLELESFSVLRGFNEFLPVDFLVKIKNTGNVHVAPAGNIFIDGPGQRDVAALSINPNGNLILPQSSRLFTVRWDDGFPRWSSQGVPTPPHSLSAFGLEWNLSQADRSRLGAYTAHLLLVYDNGERDVPIESYTTFWVIPWKVLLIIGIASALSLIGLLATGKNLWHMVQRGQE